MTTAPSIGFFVNHDYLKDLSFENPTGPIPSEQAQALRVTISGNVLTRPLDEDNRFAVEATLTIIGRDEKTCRFVCELTYAADVELSNIPEPAREQILCVNVPEQLVPRINAVIDHAGRAGGLPSLQVQGIDFLALYKKATAARAATGSQPLPLPPSPPQRNEDPAGR